VARGKRAGTRRRASFDWRVALLALGVTLTVIAWGYLVKAAIDFGTTARGGDSQAWLFLGAASLGAVACLFVALIMVARILRRLGITRGDEDEHDGDAEHPTELPRPARIPGGRRRAS
jgi:hypothetical protein